MAGSDLICLEDVREAAARIAPYVRETPLVAMTPSGLWLKAESLQPIGAFKMRGAFNALLSLSESERARGVVAHSSGNHAQAVACAAHALGIEAAIVIPENAPDLKIEATRRWGAEVHLVPFNATARVEKTRELIETHGYIEIPPFDHPAILAGTGTIALEVLRQLSEVETIYVPISGGGLIGGIAAAAKQTNRAIRIVGVEPEQANDAQQSFREGRVVSLPPEQTGRTIADGLRVSHVGNIPFANIRAYVDDIVTVSEDEIRAAMRAIAAQARLIAEPSGAVAPAAALKCSGDLSKAVAILSGGNVEPKFYAEILGG